MKMKRFTICLAVLAAWFGVGRPADAGTLKYNFTVIARAKDHANSTYHTFRGTPTIMNDGTVVFAAYRSVSGSGKNGIYGVKNGVVRTIIDSSNEFSFFDDPSVNDAGMVAFEGRLDSGVRGIYKADGVTTTTIADNTGVFRSLGGPDINNSGEVAFQAAFDAQGNNTAVYRGDGQSLTLIADESGEFSQFYFEPSINDSGLVATDAKLDTGEWALVVGDGGPPTILYDSNDLGGNIGAPDLNNAGKAVFLANSGSRIMVGDGGPLETVADTSTYRSFFSGPGPSMNNPGDVVFLADAGGAGIFAGPDPDADCIIKMPGEFLGHRVGGFAWGRGLNDSGAAAFIMRLDTGSLEDFIILAEPIPEPSTFLLATVGLLILLGCTARKRGWPI